MPSIKVAVPNRVPASRALAFAALLGASALLACGEAAQAPGPLAPQFARGGGGPPVKVTGTDPTGAEQDQTLDVRGFGSNFEPGSDAAFTLGGVATDKVRTNATTFVSSDELSANITIDADADLGLYDVEVRTPPGKKGVGTELFEVRSNNGNLMADLSMIGALSSSASRVAVAQDNPQVLQLNTMAYTVNVDLSITHANAVAEWADPAAADECIFELPAGNYDRDAVAQILLQKLVAGTVTMESGTVQFDKLAVAAGIESHDSYIRVSEVGIGRANGARYYGFIVVTSSDDVNDNTKTRMFQIEAGHGTIRALTGVQVRPHKTEVANLRCRLRDALTVTVGPSS